MQNSLSHLDKAHCVPCEGGAKPLTPQAYEPYQSEVPDWRVVDAKKLEKVFTFKNFKEALAFVNKVGDIAESEGHHPDLFLYDYKHLRITLTTHAIGGLSINDFIVARRINTLSSD